ncbi:hypothetical protein DEU56DRAFT_782570 [Suillus clintonianus]|uniref:uncharacterized protein n=1 Tax=Suillus clintonianus TaxID=1904413 RepID=UPI001B87F370|nr:uncharacterized protein DEU56DRAFT_782570 [Suillus clintonianus]KAG2148869.1 hypothetical protein DEU56DRAFT_782570 [Suillus clintonianus]
MSIDAIDSRGRAPQDIVAIFHASFHPTKGNLVDWCLKASDDLELDGVEFSTLPSGLHLVDQDVVYFTKDTHSGVCVFRRRRTAEQGHRGFRLTSLGILLAKSARPRPWRHVAALRALADSLYLSLETRGILEPSDSDWEPARVFFEERKVRRADLSGAGEWHGWSHELDNPDSELSRFNPTMHLSHLLRILGPSALTLYKHVLGRQRILIYTLPPVEAACILCQVAADICYAAQLDPSTHDINENDPATQHYTRLKGKTQEGIHVLGMVTLNDLDKMDREGKTGRGWVACTTDAIFMDKPSHYDLLIDLTTSTPSKTSRPTLYLSKPQPQQPGSKGPTHRLSVFRFTWSDIRLWNELERILQLDGDHCAQPCCRPSSDTDARNKPSSSWADPWRIYEDVCIVCAGLWMGSWRGNSVASYSTGNGSLANWGSIRLEGDDDLTVDGTFVRNLGMGIEGCPGGSPNSKGMRRSSGMIWPTGNTGADRRQTSSSSAATGSMPQLCSNGNDADPETSERRDRQILTTLALLQTFHANTSFQLSRLVELLPSVASGTPETSIIYITPKDMVSFELGPLSSLDAHYLEWLANEYGAGSQIVVKRGWKDLFGMIFGFG